MTMKKRIAGILLSFALMMGMMPVLGMTQTVYAAETWSSDLTIDSSRTIDGGVEVTDDVTVTIAENATLTVNGGINAEGKTLTVEGKGKLEVTGSNGSKGDDGGDIGSSGGAGGNGIVAGKLIINGAKVIIDGGVGGAGGDGDDDGDGGDGGNGGTGGAGVEGTVTVNSGSITVNGGSGGAGGAGGDGGIGGEGGAGGKGGNGGEGVEGTVTVNSGSITVNGGEGGTGGTGGIGGPGGEGGTGGDGGNGGAGVEGSVTVNSGSITVTGGAGGLGGGGGPGGNGGTGIAGTVTVSIGSAIATGGAGGLGISGAGYNGRAASGTLSGKTVQESDDSENWTDVSGTTSLKMFVKIEGIVEYPLWVSGVQVTSANATDVLANDPDNAGKVSFTPADGETPAKLTLNGANITADNEKQHNYSAIHYGDEENELIIDATKDSTVTGPNYDEPKEKTSYGISSESLVTVRGKLTAAGGDASSSYGVFAPAFDVEDKAEAKVLGSTGGVGIADGSSITVSGKLTAEGGVYGIYFYSGSTGIVTVNSGAELTATGGVMGIVTNSDNGYVEIKKGAKVRAVGGKNGFYNSAVEGIVKNAVPGLGWTNPEGTEGKTYFDIDTQGRKLGANIKCAEFPAAEASVTKAPAAKSLKYNGSAQELVTAGKAKGGVMKYALGTDGTTPPEKGWSSSIPKRTEAGTYYVWYMAEGDASHIDSEPQGPVKVTIAGKPPVTVQHTITYELNGGTLDGMTGTVTWTVDDGTVITLPAPTKEGYTFDYWEGSRYNSGDKYTVTGDHTFTAVWKTADNGGNGSKGGSSKGAKTGDDNTLGAWTLLLLGALTAATGMVYARKRKGE